MKPQTTVLTSVLLVLALSGCDGENAPTETKNASPKNPQSIPQTNMKKATAPQIAAPVAPDVPVKKLPAQELGKRISASRTSGEIFPALSDMHQLMNEWNPVGSTSEAITSMLGTPSSMDDKAIVYRFDHGEGGWEWTFSMKNKVVSDVVKKSLD